MGQKLKNLLIPKKPILLGLLFFFVVLGISIPARQASADFWEDLWGGALDFLTGGLTGIINLVLGTFFQVIALVGQAFLAIAIAVIRLVASPNFISLSYTNPAKNFILDIGWRLTRDLANIGFVIVLIIIGLATALRIKEYQWQKTLPVLIGVILLINFTPVIIGLVVDTSNIVMNEFLGELVKGKEWNILKTVFDNWLEGLTSITEAFTNLNYLGRGISLAVFSFMTAAILIVYAALFVLRYIAIWILVILSPLAFLAYILPKTRKYFSQWWHQLLQWSFIGVIAAFFLYLSHKILEKLPPNPAGALGIKETTGIGFLDSLLPYFIVVAFLYFAFFVGLKTSAYGATTVVKWAQIRGKKAAKGATRFTTGTIRGIPAVRKAEERIRKRLEASVIGRAVGGPGSYERQKRKKMQALGKDFEGLPPEEIRRAMRVRPFTYEDKLRQARLFELLVEKEKLSEADRGYLPMAQRMGLDMSEIWQRRPDWIENLEVRRTLRLRPDQNLQNAIGGMDPETFRKNVQREALESVNVVLYFLLDAAKVKEMGEKGKTEKKQTISDTIRGNPGQISSNPLGFTQSQIERVEDSLDEMLSDPKWPF